MWVRLREHTRGSFMCCSIFAIICFSLIETDAIIITWAFFNFFSLSSLTYTTSNTTQCVFDYCMLPFLFRPGRYSIKYSILFLHFFLLYDFNCVEKKSHISFFTKAMPTMISIMKSMCVFFWLFQHSSSISSNVYE